MCEHCCGWWEVYCTPAPMPYIKQLLNELIFPRSFSHLRWILSPCFVFSLLLPLLLQDASTSTGVKNRYIPPVQLEPNFIFMREMKSVHTGGTGRKNNNLQDPMTNQFVIGSYWMKQYAEEQRSKQKRHLWGFCSLFFIELTHWALIFSFHFRFWSQNSPFHLLHGIEAYIASSTKIRFKSVCSQYPNEKPILLNIWTGVSFFVFQRVNNPSVFSPGMAIQILISCWQQLTSIYLSDPS